MTSPGWYGRPVTALCVLLGLSAVTLALLPKVEWGQTKSGGRAAWDVIIEHFGVDSEEVERTITAPLESEMARLEGVSALRSVSEFGKTRVTSELSDDADSANFFLSLSDAVDRIEADLPRSAQKPRIVSSGGQSPAFIASLESGGPLDAFRDWVEKTVKPSVEKRPGVGEVEVGGGEIREVHVVVDESRAAAMGLTFDALAQALQTQDVLLPAGTLRRESEQPLSVRGRLEGLDAVGGAQMSLKTGTVPLSSVARVSYAGREPDTMSRLDGDERVVLLVHAAGSANLVAFSRELRSVLDGLSSQGVRSKIILDEGKVFEDALWETLRALLEGLAIVMLVLPLLLPSLRKIAALALVLPLSLVTTTALLALVSVAIDRFVLAGFAVGLGTVLDFGLLISRTENAGLSELLPSLGTALATTLLFLAPLAFLDFVWPGIRTLVIAVGILLVVAFAMTALFVPVLRGLPQTSRRLERLRDWGLRRWGRTTRRFVQAVLAFSTRRAGLVISVSGAAALAAAATVVFSGVRLGAGLDAPELSAHVEFESEASLASVDDRTTLLVNRARELSGVTSVQSLARPGSADLTVGFDSRTNRDILASELVLAGRDVPGAFVYLPQGGARTVSVQVSLSGDDNDTLKTLAKQSAKALSEAGFEQVVLNFKDAPRRLAVVFDPAKMDRAGLTAADAATALRWNLWGPVAVKWIDGDRERDLRVMGAAGRVLTRESLMNLPLIGSKGEVRLANVARLIEETGGAKIYHENRQRAVYLTVQTSEASAKTIVGAIDAALRPLEWPSGYAFQVDRRLADEERHFSVVGAALGLSLVLIGLLFGARTQSLGAPLLTLAMVPVALVFPVAVAAPGGFTVPVILALVLSGGTIVNNAILIVDAVRSRPGVRSAIRRRLSALTMTNLTALLGALPLALAGQGGLLSTLAGLVAATSVGAAVTTLTTIPALLTVFPGALTPALSLSSPSATRDPRPSRVRAVHRR